MESSAAGLCPILQTIFKYAVIYKWRSVIIQDLATSNQMLQCLMLLMYKLIYNGNKHRPTVCA
jgi:hypothetical protein